MSSFAWLDFSDSDHERALEVLDLFRERDTRDELGIATVRDALADLLFPATGTVQTRARYFLFVPWIYRILENKKIESREIANQARTAEIRLMERLLETEETAGVIGSRARANIKRLPSAIYWQGLSRLGIRYFPGSRDNYHRSLDIFYARGGARRRNDDHELVDEGRVRNWDAGLPEAPKGFPSGCTLALEPREARYLRDRLLLRAPRSLLTHLVTHTDDVGSAPFPWAHTELDSFPARNQEEILHAQNFSEVMHGAALLYNLMLSELRSDSKRELAYTEALENWNQTCSARSTALMEWNLEVFWHLVQQDGARVPSITKTFVGDWLTLVRNGARPSWPRDKRARELIINRERFLKRKQARLDGGPALELWGGASGTGQLDYRWGRIARQFVLDVQIALGKSDARTA